MDKYEFRRERFSFVFIILANLVLAGPVAGQPEVFAYPKGGQTSEQQTKDQEECRQWAVQQSGFDPSQVVTQPQATYSAPPPPSSGSTGGAMLGGAARGGALGAVGGAIAGDAGKGAAIGAAAGALFGGIRRSDRQYEQQQWQQQQEQLQQQQQQQLAQQQAQGMETYQRAFATCMRARNYEVQ